MNHNLETQEGKALAPAIGRALYAIASRNAGTAVVTGKLSTAKEADTIEMGNPCKKTGLCSL